MPHPATTPIEFILLGVAVLLGLVHILWAGSARTRQYGRDWNMGARDAAMPTLAAGPARLLRAQANFFETFPLFAAALLGAFALGHFGWKTSLGAHLYVLGRLIYLPLYATGVPRIRTTVWAVATAGVLLVLWAMVLG